MKNPAIKVTNLVKKYKTSPKSAVDDVNFEVEAGEFFAFLGPNGAGKTTTISILTTTLAKTSGKIEVLGFDLDTHEREIREKVGIIFQNPSLDLNLSAEINIRMHAFMWGIFPFRPTYTLMPAAYKKRVSELAEVLGIGNDLFKPLKTFSGGMKRKLEIVRSLMHSPKILFLDEPTTGLDPQSRKNLWEYLNQMRSSHGTTIFLTTHYLDEAEGVDHLAVIDEGKIVFDGTAKGLKAKLVRYNLHVGVNNENIEVLEKELARLGHKVQNGGSYTFEINSTQEAQKIISSLKVPLAELTLTRPSLEEAYLKLIEKSE